MWEVKIKKIKIKIKIYENIYHENVSSYKSTVVLPCLLLTVLRTSSPIPPGPQTLTAIAPTCCAVSSSTISPKQGFPSVMVMGTVEGTACAQGLLSDALSFSSSGEKASFVVRKIWMEREKSKSRNSKQEWSFWSVGTWIMGWLRRKAIQGWIQVRWSVFVLVGVVLLVVGSGRGGMG